jgi:hypothetical protein
MRDPQERETRLAEWKHLRDDYEQLLHRRSDPAVWHRLSENADAERVTTLSLQNELP